MKRVDAFQQALEAIAFAEDSTDPAADLVTCAEGLQSIAAELRGKRPAQQRALVMAVGLALESSSDECAVAVIARLARGRAS